MFTGLIEEIGKIRKVENYGGGKKFFIEARKIFDDLKIDDSVSINGVCQTVVSIENNIFSVVAVEETISKTTLKNLRAGEYVNLERALRPIDRMGGHIVQGHVDCVGVVSKIEKLATAVLIWVYYPEEFDKYVVRTGSICLDGVSLTTARVEKNSFMVSIIPHTMENTTLKYLKLGDYVNLEFDIIGKYIEKLINNNNSNTNSRIFEQFFDQPDL